MFPHIKTKLILWQTLIIMMLSKLLKEVRRKRMKRGKRRRRTRLKRKMTRRKTKTRTRIERKRKRKRRKRRWRIRRNPFTFLNNLFFNKTYTAFCLRVMVWWDPKYLNRSIKITNLNLQGKRILIVTLLIN